MGFQRYCDFCKFHRPDVVRYTLRRETDQSVHDGRRSRRRQQSAGGIDLCGECWGTIAKPRMNPNKARKREIVDVQRT